ncbi:MAG: hypothetical protein KDB95_12290 [Flavobacteriales bacterium]|nr:hypothetical protein [Flavobacteriales bacterium]
MRNGRREGVKKRRGAGQRFVAYAAFALVSCMCWAQAPTIKPPTTNNQPLNPTTLAVVLANKPERFTQEEWLHMMEKPVHRSLYPLFVTQAMLDTLDATQLDRRFQYQIERTQGR